MRLIDADALIEDFTYCGANKELVEAIIYRINQHFDVYSIDIKTKVAREIFAEIEKIIFLKHSFNENRAFVEMDFEELKKIRNKYTEVNK